MYIFDARYLLQRNALPHCIDHVELLPSIIANTPETPGRRVADSLKKISHERMYTQYEHVHYESELDSMNVSLTMAA